MTGIHPLPRYGSRSRKGYLVPLDALGRQQAIFGRSRPLGIPNSGNEGLLLDAKLLNVRIDLGYSVC